MRANTSNGSAWSQPSTSAFSSLNLLEDEDEDTDCPLCLEEMDLSDMNFKPCPCGYQICRFCWHHIKENLNGRCPACRAQYTDEAIQFKPMKPEELRRIQLAKKQRERERKNPEPNTRRNLANVRVKQKSQVHIQGMTSRYANEDTLPAMKGYDQFGQYGRILKLFLAKRTVVPDNVPNTASNQPVHVYINYSSAREASACIAAVDGTSSPDGSRLRAGWGTTKYCQAYLRGQRCQNENCMMAHEAGEEIDPVNGAPGGVTREELSTIKHALKEQETKEFQSRSGPPLPSSASWGNKPTHQPTPIGPSRPAVSTRLPKSTTHSIPARPTAPTNENIPSGPAAGNIRGRQGQSQRARGKQPEERPSVPEPSSESSHDIDETEPSTPLDEEPTPRAPQTSMPPPPGLNPLPSSSALSPPPVEPSYDHEDNPLESFGSGSFTFSFAMDIGNSPKMDSTLTDQHLGIGSDLSNHNNPAIESMTSMSSPHLRSDLSLFPHDDLNGGENGKGYKGAFDPFAETPDEIAKDDKARPKSSRFDFARKGLFGSSESLVGMASPVDLSGMNLPPRTGSSNGLPPLLTNHRSVSPSSYFDSRTSSQANSPKRGPVALSPPPGLKPNLASPALWSVSSVGPSSQAFSPPLQGFDSDAFFRSNQFSASSLPLTSAATQPLPPALPHLNTSVPPGFSSATHVLPLRSALVTSAYPLPPLQRNYGKDESFSQGQEGFQYRSGSSGFDSPALRDPAILNMSRYTPSPFQPDYQQQQQQFGMPYYEGQQNQGMYLPQQAKKRALPAMDPFGLSR